MHLGVMQLAPTDLRIRAQAMVDAFEEARELAEAFAAPPSLIEYLSSRITVCQATQRYAEAQIHAAPTHQH